MNRVYILVTVVLLVAIPLHYVPQMVYELNHPEVWGDWTRNPILYMPLLAALVVFWVYFAVDYRRWRREFRERIDAMSDAEFETYLEVRNEARKGGNP
jgi:hypothetical protein